MIAKEKDGGPRFRVDFRPLNKRMRADRWPIPNIEELIDETEGRKIFNNLDLFTGYWNIRLDEDVQEMATFQCKYGSFCSVSMPLWVKNGPDCFQMLASIFFPDLLYAILYIDDTIIKSAMWEEHLDFLKIVLGRLQQAVLRIRVYECAFGAG